LVERVRTRTDILQLSTVESSTDLLAGSGPIATLWTKRMCVAIPVRRA